MSDTFDLTTASALFDGVTDASPAAVAPFAIDKGIIRKPFRRGHCPDKKLAAREVRIWQTGTQKVLIAHVPVDESTGLSISSGSHEIAGVPGTAAPILMDFRRVRCISIEVRNFPRLAANELNCRQWEHHMIMESYRLRMR